MYFRRWRFHWWCLLDWRPGKWRTKDDSVPLLSMIRTTIILRIIKYYYTNFNLLFVHVVIVQCILISNWTLVPCAWIFHVLCVVQFLYDVKVVDNRILMRFIFLNRNGKGMEINLKKYAVDWWWLWGEWMKTWGLVNLRWSFFFGIIFLLENVHLVVITKNFTDRWCAFLPMKKDYVNN